MEFKTEVTLSFTKDPFGSYAYAYVLIPIGDASKIVFETPEQPKKLSQRL